MAEKPRELSPEEKLWAAKEYLSGKDSTYSITSEEMRSSFQTIPKSFIVSPLSWMFYKHSWQAKEVIQNLVPIIIFLLLILSEYII